MPEPFKNLFNPALIESMGQHLYRVSEDFDHRRFVRYACAGLEQLELKARSAQICDALEACLPVDFPQACAVLRASLHPEDDVDLRELTMDADGIRGWAIMPMAEFIARHGLAHFDLGMATLAAMTRRFTAEFAVRPFIIQQPERAFQWLHRWAEDDNYHLRRLASEGARPRLPWGQQIPHLIKNPEPLLPLLDKLKDDEHEYVRRSVANNLNDIAKDHPHLLVDLAKQWWPDGSSKRRKLIRHAGRTLIKQGHQPLLELLGFFEPKIRISSARLSPSSVSMGGEVHLEFTLVSESDQEQSLVVDYVVWYQRKTAQLSSKVFKWKTLTLKPGQALRLIKTHSLRPVTTRVYYPGAHRVDIQVNGRLVETLNFELCD